MICKKTVTLTGTEQKVELHGRHCDVRNDGTGVVYVSCTPGVVPDADGVLSVPAGQAVKYCGCRGVVYLLGTGKVQLCGNDYSSPVFKHAAAPSGVGGVSGTALNIQNSAEFPLLEMKLYGKSTQGYASHGGTPLGKNLYEGSQDWSGEWLNSEFWTTADETYNGLVVKKKTASYGGLTKKIPVVGGKTYVFSVFVKINANAPVIIFANWNHTDDSALPVESSNGATLTANSWTRLSIKYVCTKSGYINPRVELPTEGIEISVCGYQLEEGATATDYEPYYSAPNPSCPVPIENVGDDGELSVTACGKNLINIPDKDYVEGGYLITESMPMLLPAGRYTLHFNIDEMTSEIANIQTQFYIRNKSGKAIRNFLRPLGDYCNERFFTFNLSEDGVKGVFFVNNTANYNFTISNISIMQGDTGTLYEPYSGATAALTSALPLCGLPVSEGGNYTDSNGQQWISDELIYNADGTGKVVKRFGVEVFDGSEDEVWSRFTSYYEGKYRWKCTVSDIKKVLNTQTTANLLCDSYETMGSAKTWFGNQGIAVSSTESVLIVYDDACSLLTLTDWKARLASNPISVVYELATPEEINLTAEEMAQLYQLYSYNSTTNIFNDEGAEMAVKYCNSPLISEYYLPMVKAATE